MNKVAAQASYIQQQDIYKVNTISIQQNDD